MANTHETIADIIAEIRALSNPLKDGIIAINGRQIADRLDAAHKRERGDCAKLRETISNLRTALKEIRDDVLDMVMNYKSEDPDSYAHGLCLSIGGACDMALNSTKEFGDADK